jgi:hypothetical protein
MAVILDPDLRFIAASRAQSCYTQVWSRSRRKRSSL